MDDERWAGRLKLDLHTHCGEGTSYDDPTIDSVGEIVAAIRSKGLDGIGVTEHYNKVYGFKVKAIVDRHFSGEVLIIPGSEVDYRRLHVVELYLPGDLTFRFVAHPGHPGVADLSLLVDDSIHGIELRNPAHDYEMDEAAIRSAARQHDLLLLQNSDAHYLNDIGRYCNEIKIEQLRARAGRSPRCR